MTYSGNSVKVVMYGSPETADEKFVVGGLVNPTIHVAKGATVTLELINEDDGMPHGLFITPTAPPYSYMGTMMSGTYPGAYLPVIPAPQKSQNHILLCR